MHFNVRDLKKLFKTNFDKLREAKEAPLETGFNVLLCVNFQFLFTSHFISPISFFLSFAIWILLLSFFSHRTIQKKEKYMYNFFWHFHVETLLCVRHLISSNFSLFHTLKHESAVRLISSSSSSTYFFALHVCDFNYLWHKFKYCSLYMYLSVLSELIAHAYVWITL